MKWNVISVNYFSGRRSEVVINSEPISLINAVFLLAEKMGENKRVHTREQYVIAPEDYETHNE